MMSKVTGRIYLDGVAIAKSDGAGQFVIDDILHRYTAILQDFLHGTEPADKLRLVIEVKR